MRGSENTPPPFLSVKGLIEGFYLNLRCSLFKISFYKIRKQNNEKVSKIISKLKNIRVQSNCRIKGILCSLENIQTCHGNPYFTTYTSLFYQKTTKFSKFSCLTPPPFPLQSHKENQFLNKIMKGPKELRTKELDINQKNKNI